MLLQIALIIIFLFCLLQSDIINTMEKITAILLLMALGAAVQVQYLFYNFIFVKYMQVKYEVHFTYFVWNLILLDVNWQSWWGR